MPRAVEGRNIYLCSPEYMASFARKAIAAGAQIVGGCCGTTPNHIRAMRSAMRAMDAQARVESTGAEPVLNPETPPAPLGAAFPRWVADCEGQVCDAGGDCAAQGHRLLEGD